MPYTASSPSGASSRAARPGPARAAGADRRRLHGRPGRHRPAARRARSAPTPQQRLLAPRIASILEQNHYRHIPIDEQLSPLVFEHFLTALDGQHSYFLASDIAGFERWKTQVRRHDPHRRARSGLPDLQRVPAAQPRAHRLRAQAARHRAGLDASTRASRSTASTRPGPTTRGARWTSCGASASRTTRSRSC